MVPIKPVETLHNYLRRHFEKVSNRKARQLAEQTEVPKVHVDPDSRPLMEAEASHQNEESFA
jgi:hypothetical protein